MYLKQEMGNTSEDYLGFLSLVDVFEPLSPEEVVALGQEANLRVGEILYAPAERCEPLFVLKRSRVRLYRRRLRSASLRYP